MPDDSPNSVMSKDHAWTLVFDLLRRYGAELRARAEEQGRVAALEANFCAPLPDPTPNVKTANK